jgi:hypothetical protein
MIAMHKISMKSSHSLIEQVIQGQSRPGLRVSESAQTCPSFQWKSNSRLNFLSESLIYDKDLLFSEQRHSGTNN